MTFSTINYLQNGENFIKLLFLSLEISDVLLLQVEFTKRNTDAIVF